MLPMKTDIRVSVKEGRLWRADSSEVDNRPESAPPAEQPTADGGVVKFDFQRHLGFAVMARYKWCQCPPMLWSL